MNNPRNIRMVIAKGRMYDQIARLLEDTGIGLKTNNRCYIPHVSDPEIEAKIMKPQNIGQLIELGKHDIGFTGLDWIRETGADVVELMDLSFNQVRIVAAVPEGMEKSDLTGRRIIVASEYERIAADWLKSQDYSYLLLRTFGATEAFPPGDADMIIDNSSSGLTLREHGLKVLDVILNSSTRLIANRGALKNPHKREKIEELVMLFRASLHARARVMLEMNAPKERLDGIVAVLPCMRAPTVAPLYSGQGFSIRAAVPREKIVKLVPQLKKLGATDILEHDFRKVIS
jgi:ATP phosphoribosyltransferase